MELTEADRHEMEQFKPDYSYYAKMDRLSRTEFALILSGIEPNLYNKKEHRYLLEIDEPHLPATCRYGGRMLIMGLRYAKKIYGLLDRVNWNQKYEDSYCPADGGTITMAALIKETKEKEISIPDEFLSQVERRLELSSESSSNQEVEETQKQLSSRAEHNHLKAIGLMAILLSKKSNTYKYGENVSAKKIKEDVCNLAANLEIEADGLKSLNKDISSGLKLLKTSYLINIEEIDEP